MATRQVRFGHYLAYGSNDFLGAGSDVHHRLLDPVLLYTTFCGLSAAQAGIIFVVVARLLDAFFSPVIGYISDHFHRTWAGRSSGAAVSSCCWRCH